MHRKVKLIIVVLLVILSTYSFTVESLITPWDKYAGNPILSPEGNEDLTAWGSIWKDGATYHMFYSYKDASNNLQVGHATSSDGESWTKDSANNPILTKGSGWDNGQVWDPVVWKESSTWYMLYTGRNSGSSAEAIGLATASNPEGLWTKEPTNPVLEGTAGEWDANSAENMNLIKVGSTYYLWYNTLLGAGANRKSGLATSIDLTTWTKDANNPIFSASGGYFQLTPFKYGSYYYLLVPHYTSGSDYSKIQLYRDTNPTFYSGDREYLGIAIDIGTSPAWDSHDQDTPCVLTTDITRSTFPNDELYCMYAGEYGGTWKTGKTLETNIAEALGVNSSNSSIISFQSINGQENSSVLQDQYRYFVWTRNESATKYSIRVSNYSDFHAEIFLQLDNITISNGNCTNIFLNTSASARPGDYNYWENSTHCFFYLPYCYNITEYKYHYYQVRAYTT